MADLSLALGSCVFHFHSLFKYTWFLLSSISYVLWYFHVDGRNLISTSIFLQNQQDSFTGRLDLRAEQARDRSHRVSGVSYRSQDMDIAEFDDLAAIDNQIVAKDNPDSWLWPEDPFKLDSESHIGQHPSHCMVQLSWTEVFIISVCTGYGQLRGWYFCTCWDSPIDACYDSFLRWRSCVRMFADARFFVTLYCRNCQVLLGWSDSEWWRNIRLDSPNCGWEGVKPFVFRWV